MSCVGLKGEALKNCLMKAAVKRNKAKKDASNERALANEKSIKDRTAKRKALIASRYKKRVLAGTQEVMEKRKLMPDKGVVNKEEMKITQDRKKFIAEDKLAAAIKRNAAKK